MRVRNKNGDECILEYRNWLVELPDGTSVCRGVVRNVTEKIILESQLIQAQKMESIGTLAAGISHNFRNLLTGILTNSQIIQLKYKEDQELLRYTERINELSKMGADLITDLMQFSRKASLESKALINLGDVLNETLNIISKSFAEDITINSEWADFMPVYGDRSTLSQVFLNICTNARDAMPEGGSIFFEAKIKGEKVIVTITDTGCGIDKSIINFIFDPFFTTKEHGYGTGLGLSTAYGIVKAHKGEIKVKSKANKGTSFIISLPLASKKGKGEKKPDFTVSSGVNEKVLIVDKNKMVLETMNESITNLGYKAATAENIKDAIELCASWEPDILMLCDKIDDIEDLMESEKIFSVISKIKIIIVTEEENKKLTDIKSKIREYVAAFLLKPFDLAGLGKVLAETVKKK
jgi:nitrogen-specific signal transduction histidine kinase/CheY-like chemotaxis protein